MRFAVENGHDEVVHLVWKSDPDVEAAAHDGKRALDPAVEMSQAKTLDIGLAADANIQAGVDDGRNPLMFALRNDRGLAIIKSLSNNRAELEATSGNARTALQWSVNRLGLMFANLSLSCSAKVNASERGGNTAEGADPI